MLGFNVAVIAAAMLHAASGNAVTTAPADSHSASYLKWGVTDRAPRSVQHFVDTIAVQKEAYIDARQRKITDLKSQIADFKQQRTEGSKTQVIFKSVGGGASEADGNAYAKEEHDAMVISGQIEQKWKDVHASEAEIAAAQSDPLWLPPPVAESDYEQTEFGPLPANYMHYLIKVPIGSGAPPPSVPIDEQIPVGGRNDPNCLVLADPKWDSNGTAAPQVLREGVNGLALEFKPLSDAISVQAIDPAQLVLKAERKSLGLGDVALAPVAKLNLEEGKLVLLWTNRGGEPAAASALQMAVLNIRSGDGVIVSSFHFTPCIQQTLDCTHSGDTKLSLPPVTAKQGAWQIVGLQAGWTIDAPAVSPSSVSQASVLAAASTQPQSSPLLPNPVKLQAGNDVLLISYDSTNSNVQVIRSDPLQDQYDALRAKMSHLKGSGVTMRNSAGMSKLNAQRSTTEAQIQTLRSQLIEDHQQWQGLSSCTACITLPNGLRIAQLRLIAASELPETSQSPESNLSPGDSQATDQRPTASSNHKRGGSLFSDDPAEPKSNAATPASSSDPVISFDFGRQSFDPRVTVITMANNAAVRGELHHVVTTKTANGSGLQFNGGADPGKSDPSPDADHSYFDLGRSIPGFPLNDFTISVRVAATNDGSIIGSGQDELWPREWGLSAGAFWWSSTPGHSHGAAGKVSNMVTFKTRPNVSNNICVTRQGKVVTVYVNGSLVAQQSDFPAEEPLPIYGNGLMIGNTKRNSGRYTQWNTFGGSIASIAIYSRVMNDTEVRQLSTAGSTPAPVVASPSADSGSVQKRPLPTDAGRPAVPNSGGE